MDKKIDCIALEPLKRDGVRVMPGQPIQLSEAEFEEQHAAGRVALDGDAAFTPAEPAAGVATMGADPDPTDDDAFVDPLESHANAADSELTAPGMEEAAADAAQEEAAQTEAGGDVLPQGEAAKQAPRKRASNKAR